VPANVDWPGALELAGDPHETLKTPGRNEIRALDMQHVIDARILMTQLYDRCAEGAQAINGFARERLCRQAEKVAA
jgi:hypothetical protein